VIGTDSAVGGGDTPLRLHELRFEQALERRIERSFFHLEQVVRSLLDVLDERVPMGGLAAKRLEDHHFECTGEEIARRGCFHRLYSDRHRLNKYQPFGKRKALRSTLDGKSRANDQSVPHPDFSRLVRLFEPVRTLYFAMAGPFALARIESIADST
jgi:hypothetical protein